MSKSYFIIAPAKLNLNLFITGKNINGYHILKSDVCFLELADEIYIEINDKDVFFQNNSLEITRDRGLRRERKFQRKVWCSVVLSELRETCTHSVDFLLHIVNGRHIFADFFVQRKKAE